VTSGWVFLTSFASTTVGIALGMTLRTRLPAPHLKQETKEVIRLGAGLLATLAAVLISLMIASAKTSYDTQDAHFQQFASHVILADQLLAQYGPEAIGVRKLMRQAVPEALDRIWREKATRASQDTAFTPTSAAEQIYHAIEALPTADDEQRALGLVVVVGGGRAAAVHYIRPVERDREGHLQRRPPAVLSTWDDARGTVEHFAWAMTPELAARIMRLMGSEKIASEVSAAQREMR